MTPRYSIIPGDFATDPRADVGHFRVLNLIGRHTDAAGWCRLKQLTIANEVGLSRKTVNLKIQDLVAWGYVEKRASDATGRAIWYRTIMDRPIAPPAVAPDDGDAAIADASEALSHPRRPVTRALHVGCNSEPTCNPLEVTPGVTTGRNTERPLLNDQVKNPLPHGAEGATGDEINSDLVRKAHALIAELKTAGADEAVIEHLLRPILERRRFSAADKPGELLRLAVEAKGLSAAALANAAKFVLEGDVQTVKPQRIYGAIAKARLVGAMVVIRNGSPEWQRWSEHFRDVDPVQARTMARFDTWQVPSQWPPAKSGRAA